jgi:hypothetical protein
MPSESVVATMKRKRNGRWKNARKPPASMVELMRAQGKRGNPRDYVVLSQHRLIQDGKHLRELREPTEAIPLMPAAVHKSQLAQYVGEEIAADYWHKAIGRRVVRPREG